MPRKQLPPRLYLRKRKGRAPVFVVKDAGKEHSTGCGAEDRAGAEAWLAEYLARRFRAPDAPQTPDEMGIADALAIYASEHAPHAADPARIGYAIEALLQFWGDLKVSAVRGQTCRLYAKKRILYAKRETISDGTIRRELGTLRAAFRYCQEEGYLTQAPVVPLPERPPARDRWLTRSEVAAMLRVARADPHTRHLARFILIAVYTGTRKEDILRLQFTPSMTGGHFDLENGVLHRKSLTARKTKKRGTPAKLPRQLLAHARRWERNSIRYAVEYAGRPVKDIKRAWASVAERAGVTGTSPHTAKHTAITWAMQRGAKLPDAAAFFGTSIQTIESTYFHHHPDFQQSAVAALENR